MSQKNWYAVSLLLQKNDGQKYTFSHSLHVHEANSENEAIGIAMKSAENIKPGFAVSDPLCSLISKG